MLFMAAKSSTLGVGEVIYAALLKFDEVCSTVRTIYAPKDELLRKIPSGVLVFSNWCKVAHHSRGIFSADCNSIRKNNLN